MKIDILNSEGLNLVTEITCSIDRKEIYRLSGIKDYNKPFSPKLEKIIDEKIEQVCHLIDAKSLYLIKDISEINDEKIFFSDTSYLNVKSFRPFMSSIKKIAITLCTLGEPLDKEVDSLNNKGSYTEALILDIIGSVAVEEVANKINFIICEKAKNYGLETSQRFSPGYGNFDLSEQLNIFNIINAKKIRVSLTNSFMMIPKKSISFCVYLGKLKEQMPKQCTICGLVNCKFRRY